MIIAQLKVILLETETWLENICGNKDTVLTCSPMFFVTRKEIPILICRTNISILEVMALGHKLSP